MFIELIENEISELDKKTIKQGRYFVLEEKIIDTISKIENLNPVFSF